MEDTLDLHIEGATQTVARDVIVAASQQTQNERAASGSHEQVSQNTDSAVAQSITRQIVAVTSLEAESKQDQLHEPAVSEGYAAAQGVASHVMAAATSDGITALGPTSRQEQVHPKAGGYAVAETVAREVVASASQPPVRQSPPSYIESEEADSLVAQYVARETVDASRDSAAPPPMRVMEEVAASHGGGSNASCQNTESAVAQSITRQIVALTSSEVEPQQDQLHEGAVSEGYAAAQVAKEVVASASQPPVRQSPPSYIESEKADSVVAQYAAREAVDACLGSAEAPSTRVMEEVAASHGGGSNASCQNTESAVAQSITRQIVALTSSEVEPQQDQLHEPAVSEGYAAAQGVASHVMAAATSDGITALGPTSRQEQVHPEAGGYAVAETVAREAVASASQPPVRQSPPSYIESEEADSVVAQYVARETVDASRDSAAPPPMRVMEEVAASHGGSLDASCQNTESAVAQSITRQIVALTSSEVEPQQDQLHEPAVSEGYAAAQGVASHVMAAATSDGITALGPTSLQEQVHPEAGGYAVAETVAREVVASASQPPVRQSPPSYIESEEADSVVAQYVARETVDASRDSAAPPPMRVMEEVAASDSGSLDASDQNTDSAVAQSITRQIVALTSSEVESQQDQLHEPAVSEGYAAAQGVASHVMAAATSDGITALGPTSLQEQVHPEAGGYAVAETVAREVVASASQPPVRQSPPSYIESEEADSVVAQAIAGEIVKPGFS